MARAKKKKPPPRVGRKKPAKAKKGKPARKKATKKKAAKKRSVKAPSKALAARRKKEARPIRWRYDEDGFPISFYVPLRFQTKTQQRGASRSMVSACSLGAFRQGVSPSKTCGTRGLKTGERAGRGYAYSRWGYPKGWPRKQFKNPTTPYQGQLISTYLFDPTGEWAFDILDPDTGTVWCACRGAESEGGALREAQATILDAEATMNPAPTYKPEVFGRLIDKKGPHEIRARMDPQHPGEVQVTVLEDGEVYTSTTSPEGTVAYKMAMSDFRSLTKPPKKKSAKKARKNPSVGRLVAAALK